MKSVRVWSGVVVACAVVLSSGAAVRGGDLDPPPGPIQPTDRFVLNQASTPVPHIISASGSYKLTSDLVAGGGSFVLEVNAPDVTIDLNGFTIDGGGVAPRGIQVLNTAVTIRNGHIRNCVGEGVDGAADGTVVEDVSVRNCGIGITAINGGRVSGCAVREVQGDGIVVDESSIVENCTVMNAGQGGTGWGILARNGSTVVGSTVRLSPNGITGFGAATIDRCVVAFCTVIAFRGEEGAVIRACSARQGSTGFRVRSSTAIDCVAFQNLSYGYEAAEDAVVDRCQAIECGARGIVAGDRCRITGNTCTRNSFGIEIVGSNGRISGNTVIQSAIVSYSITGVGNTVFANTSSTPGLGFHYDVAPGNDVATVSTAAAATVGNENIQN